MDICGTKLMRISLVAMGLLLLWGGLAAAQTAPTSAREFEEIVISFEVPKLIREDVFVQYDGHTVYLPLIKVFNLLDINIETDSQHRIFSGFFISKDKKYEFDLASYRIKVFGKEYPYLASDYILANNELYVRVGLLAQLFNLRMTFEFNMLRVHLALEKEFPAYRALKRRAARERLQKQIESLKDVIHVRHQRQWLSGGTIDWSVSSNPIGNRDQHYYSLVTGGVLLGGDLEITTGGSKDQLWDPHQFDYRWHYYLSDNKYLSQAEAGRVNIGGALSRSLTGGMLTNRPQARREYFQTITIRDYVGEGWEVELWIDNKLTDFQVTDRDGFYDFNTDIFYGASNIELKMYGPNGELRTDDKVVRVPYNLIPEGDFEYAIAGGTVGVNNVDRNYVQANSYYGIINSLTMGVNLELPVQSPDEEKPIAAVDATYQLFGNLTFNGSYANNYAAKAAVNFSQPSVVNINAAYTSYHENIVRNPLHQKSRINFSISSPFKIGTRYFGLRYNVSMDTYPSLVSVNMNYGFNASVYPFHLTYMGKFKQSEFTSKIVKSMSSQVLLSTRLLRFLRPQIRVDYDHTNHTFSKYGAYVAKRLFRNAQLAVSFEHNVMAKTNTIMATFNLFTGFADFTSRFMRTSSRTSYNQLQRGSIRYDRETRSLQFDRKNGVGTASAVVRPFHDANYNGVMDAGEDYISGLRARIDGGRMSLRGEDRQYYYDGLRPYEDYLVRIDQYSLDNPLLKPTHENYRVKINPNIVTAVKVPIVTTSEISGRVDRELGAATRGVAGTKIVLMNLSKETLIELTTFNSGDYYYLGLIPGSYKAYIDPDQLKQYGYVSKPAFIEFEIKPVEGGTSVEEINFMLLPEETHPETADTQ